MTHSVHVPRSSNPDRTYLQPLRRHVAPRADEGVGHGVDEFAGDAKVADLDLSRAVHQDVGRLHVAVDDGVLLAQVAQPSEHLRIILVRIINMHVLRDLV